MHSPLILGRCAPHPLAPCSHHPYAHSVHLAALFLPSGRTGATIDDVIKFNDLWDCKLALLRNDCRCYQRALVALLVDEQ